MSPITLREVGDCILLQHALYGAALEDYVEAVLVQKQWCKQLKVYLKYTHVTIFSHELHWLPLDFQVEFKILVLIYNGLQGMGPSYQGPIFPICLLGP